MQHLRIVIALISAAIFTSCSESTQPAESDERFADIVDVKLSVHADGLTCLLYVKTYRSCEEPRVAHSNVSASGLELGVTTFKLATSECTPDTTVKKVWHTFTGLSGGASYSLRIQSERDTRTNKKVDTTVVVNIP